MEPLQLLALEIVNFDQLYVGERKVGNIRELELGRDRFAVQELLREYVFNAERGIHPRNRGGDSGVLSKAPREIYCVIVRVSDLVSGYLDGPCWGQE